MLRGAWLARSDLDELLSRLAEIQSRTAAVAQSGADDLEAWTKQIAGRAGRQREAGYVFPG